MILSLIVWTAYAFSVVSFALFVYFVLRGPRDAESGTGLGGARQEGAVQDIAAVTEALAKLADSFARAGPAVMTLVAALFFFMAALTGAGIEALPSVRE